MLIRPAYRKLGSKWQLLQGAHDRQWQIKNALANAIFQTVITLHRDTLTFAFPEIAQEVRSLVQHKIKEVAAELPPIWDRDELVSQIESSRCFDELSQEAQERARSRMRTWIPADVEGRLEEFAFNLAGVGRDSLTALDVKFQRTMRIPDDGETYALPIGLGQLPLRSVDDFPETAPARWLKEGGVILPLARSEALWIWFSSTYHFAIKIEVGNVDGLSGKVPTGIAERTSKLFYCACLFQRRL